DSPRLKHLLEYWHPDRVNDPSLDQTRPPVWISVVGRNGVWPIQVGEPSEGDRELYQRYVYGATQNFGPGTDEERDVSEREVSWLWVSVIVAMLLVTVAILVTAWKSATPASESKLSRSRQGELYVYLGLCVVTLAVFYLFLGSYYRPVTGERSVALIRLGLVANVFLLIAGTLGPVLVALLV